MKYKKYLLTFFLFVLTLVFIISLSHDLKLEGIPGLSIYEKGRTYYLGYNVMKKGFLSPAIKDIVLLREDGTPYEKDDYDIKYDFYIDKKYHTGAIDESDLKNNSSFFDYVSPEGYKIEKDKFQIVLGISFIIDKFSNDLKGIRVTYRLLFINKEEMLDFDIITFPID